MFLRLNMASDGVSLAATMQTFQSDVTKRRYCSSVSQLLSGARWTPSVHCALFVLSLGIVTWCCQSSLIVSSPGCCDLVMYFHVLLVNWKSIRYQKQFVGTRAPPVACNKPSHWLTEFCISSQTF